MEQEILRNLPSNWNVFVLNGDQYPVSPIVRQHIRKLHPQLSTRRSRTSKPMVVLFYFANGYVAGSKRYRNRKTKRIRVDAPVEQASDESTCQSDSIQTDQPPIQSDVVTADLSQHHLIEQVPGESIEDPVLSDLPTTCSYSFPLIQDFTNLCIEQSLDEIHLPEPSVKTVVPINVQDQFNENEDNEENVDENEPLSILEIRQNNKNILDEWDEKVTRIEEEISRVYKQTKIQIRNLTLETNKQVRNLKNQVNVVVAERAKVEEELSIRLQEKILDWKLKRSDKTRKKTKRPGTKKIFRR